MGALGRSEEGGCIGGTGREGEPRDVAHASCSNGFQPGLTFTDINRPTPQLQPAGDPHITESRPSQHAPYPPLRRGGRGTRGGCGEPGPCIRRACEDKRKGEAGGCKGGRPQLCENPHCRWTHPFGQASAGEPPLWLHPLIRVIITTP